MRKYTKKTAGLTLLEVMIALAILAISSSSLLLIRNEAVRQSIQAIEFRQCQNLLEQKMTEVMIGIEKRDSGDFRKEGFEHFKWTVDVRIKVLSAKGEQGSVSLNLKEIEVIVFHRDTEEKKYSLKTEILEKRPDEVKDE